MRIWTCLFVLTIAASAPVPASSQPAGGERRETRKVVEIRSYNLKPGTRDRFHRLFLTEALPMLRRWNVDVIAYGPSFHDEDSYFLMRGFDGLDVRQKSEDAFYGSDEWITGPRARVLADIDAYTTIVINLDDATTEGLRKAGGPGMAAETANDLDVLTKLNEDYVRSVQRSDVKRFEEILADDFFCTMADGSFLDRRAFLEQTAKPVTIIELQAHDLNIRLMDNFAIVHARTSYTTADGKSSGGRYTDVWAKRNGRWVAVSAHVTRR
jgi:ketosteroid isomerase-like protein